MLQTLSIRDVALIDRLEIQFGEGFNVLTGETGAGKSIVIDAVNLVLGERASRELIKHGSAKALVEAVFLLSEDSPARAVLERLGIEAEEELVISRELSAAGKNVCRVNGTLLTLSALKSITDPIVDVHGQHAHQSLLQPENHIAFLDLYGGGELTALKEHVNALSQEYRDIRAQQLSGFPSEAERAREIDILSYQIREIDSAALAPGEEERLLGERRLLSNAEKIMAALEESFSLINGEEGALQSLRRAQRSMGGIGELSEEYAELGKSMDNAYYALEDVGITLREQRSLFEFDPERLEAVEQRLDRIKDLKRKYGSDIGEILRFRDEAAKRLEEIGDAERRHAALEKAVGAAMDAYSKAAEALSQSRKAKAKALEESLTEQLHALGMAKARFGVQLSWKESECCPMDGMDQVAFLFSANSGEPLKALDRVASGGELSRIMLALKTLCADKDRIDTLIFDEIDTGISGKAAAAVGSRMMAIANKRQVICVTHLPQIAAYSDIHFLVEKMDDGQHTHTLVRALDKDEEAKRLAAMISGESISPLAMELSSQLLERCQMEKQKLRSIT